MHKPDDDPALGDRNLRGFHQGVVEASLSKNIQPAEYRGALHLHIKHPPSRLVVVGLRKVETDLIEPIDQGELILQLRGGRDAYSRALEKCRVGGTRDRSAWRGMGEAAGIESVVGAPGLSLAVALG